jgi:hypothetical protein
MRARQSTSWRAFLSQHQHQLLVCDFFTVEMLRLKTLYVLFFIEVGTRRIHTECWVRSIREECLDHLLILNERHLEHVHLRYYNRARPHQGIGQQVPESANDQPGKGSVQRRDILGGLLHDYHCDAV